MRRTQIYLTNEQLIELKRAAAHRRVSMAEVIRTAIDAFLKRDADADPERVLDATFGGLPDLEVPSRQEWDRNVG